MPFAFHASQARRTTLRATLVLAAVVPVAAAHAQSGASAASADTTTRRQGTMLAPVVITAEPHSPSLGEEGIIGRILRVDREHHEVVNRMADNHKLAAYVNWQGKEITRLENKLTYLKTTVTDSITRQIAQADSATASVHAQRMALEARLAELEARQVARRAPEPAAEPAARPAAGGTR